MRLSTKILLALNKLFKAPVHPLNLQDEGVMSYAMWQYKKGAETIRYYLEAYTEDDMFKDKVVLDIGCGAGFPGVPLKIAEPSMELTLLDSLAKRMHWLEELLPQLGVQAQVVTARAEEYVRTCRESYDIVTSRAVARLNVLAELCLPYAKVGGVFLAMKGALADEEIDEARRGIAQLGGSIERVYEYPIQDAVHKAVVIRKQKPTPPKYPRAFAKIKKSPL